MVPGSLNWIQSIPLGYQKFTCCGMEPIDARLVSHLCDEPAIPEVAKLEFPK
jgi:hypothetical protein